MPYKSMILVVKLPQDLDIGRPIQNEHSLELPVKPPKAVPVCPHCHSSGCISKGSDGYQSIRHVPSGNTGVFLTFKKLRFYCADCRASFTYHYPWQHYPLPITDALSSRHTPYGACPSQNRACGFPAPGSVQN